MTPQEVEFREAFRLELAARPHVPPGPTALSRRMRMRTTNNLPGRLSKLRRRLLFESGFTQPRGIGGRWVKR